MPPNGQRPVPSNADGISTGAVEVQLGELSFPSAPDQAAMANPGCAAGHRTLHQHQGSGCLWGAMTLRVHIILRRSAATAKRPMVSDDACSRPVARLVVCMICGQGCHRLRPCSGNRLQFSGPSKPQSHACLPHLLRADCAETLAFPLKAPAEQYSHGWSCL